MAEVTCLEKRSDEARNEQIVRSDYNFNNQYSANHMDAKADGDSRGKGTGSTGHGAWLPDCNAPINVFNYSNFDTAYESHAGNKDDNDARNKAMVQSKYSPNNPYGDVQFNGQEGQYFVP